MANYPLKVLSILEKTHKFDKLPNLKYFPSATRIAISDKKVNDHNLCFFYLKKSRL
jgi:hypothetical protein